MKYDHVQEAARDAKQMEENSILGGDPLLETCTCTRIETEFSQMCDYCQTLEKKHPGYFAGLEPSWTGTNSREGDGHDSDCATHNEPAYPNGECDCIASLPQRLRKLSAENKGPRDCIDEAADKIDQLKRDSERLEWLMRNVSGKEFRRLGVTYGGNCGRDRIDAAMVRHNVIVTGLAPAQEEQ